MLGWLHVSVPAEAQATGACDGCRFIRCSRRCTGTRRWVTMGKIEVADMGVAGGARVIEVQARIIEVGGAGARVKEVQARVIEVVGMGVAGGARVIEVAGMGVAGGARVIEVVGMGVAGGARAEQIMSKESKRSKGTESQFDNGKHARS